MGFMNKLRAELIDIVEWVDDSRHTLVWRFPRFHNQIKNGAQLIVRPGQSAIFVHQGRIADVFEPGTYRLTTENLPLLSKKKWFTQTRYGYARGWEPVRYVENIRTYYDVLVWMTETREADSGKQHEPIQFDSPAL